MISAFRFYFPFTSFYKTLVFRAQAFSLSKRIIWSIIHFPIRSTSKRIHHHLFLSVLFHPFFFFSAKVFIHQIRNDRRDCLKGIPLRQWKSDHRYRGDYPFFYMHISEKIRAIKRIKVDFLQLFLLSQFSSHHFLLSASFFYMCSMSSWSRKQRSFHKWKKKVSTTSSKKKKKWG